MGSDSETNGHANGPSAPSINAHPDTIPLWINGQQVTSKVTEPVIAPSTGKTIHHFSSAMHEDCIAAINAASRAFPAWSRTTLVERRQILLKAADIFEKYNEEHIQAMLGETGEHRDYIQDVIDTKLPVEFLRDTGGRLVTVMDGSVRSGLDPTRRAILSKEPYGVCFAMAPWNMPHTLGLRSFLGAIAVGNTVVLKGSEMSPKCHWQLGRVMKEAGLPDGVLNIIFTRREDSAETVRSLIEHRAIKHVNFTGSTGVGRIVAGLAGKNLKPCIMELGGKAPAIVLDDADIEKAAFEVALGALSHSGQICMSTERAIVQKAIADDFIDALKKAAARLTPEKKMVLASAGGLAKSHQVVSRTVDQGAHIVHGTLEKPSEDGNRMNPIILGGVKKEMELYHTESFGPSVSLFVVETEDEAIEIANDTDYGLTAAVFSENLGRAMRVAGRIESGAVHINSMTVHDDPNYPHGGFKDSGFGRFNGNNGLDGFLQTKVVSWRV